jgi:diacylglycerol kinase (ATP)
MTIKKKILLVVNPVSGGRDKKVFIDAAQQYADNRGYEVVLFETSGEDDRGRLQNAFELHQPTRVVIAGGDGSIKMAADALEDKDVVFGILPAGSANGLSVDLSLPSALDQLIEIAFEGDAVSLDMILINGHKSVHLSDIGLNAELIRNYENSSIRGKLGYALQSINTLTDSPVLFDVQVSAQGVITQCESKLVIIANSQKYGTGVTINPFGKLNDGLFEIVIFKSLDFLTVTKIITGNMPLDSNDVEILRTSSAVIQTNIPVHFQIDGEYYGEVDKLEIKILPRQFKVAAPAQTDGGGSILQEVQNT